MRAWELGPTEVQMLAEIHRLLAEAYEHYFEFSDGHCKSGEGAVSLHWPSFYWREDRPEEPSVEIYSYVLGPGRTHHFKNLRDALDTVREWHASELAHDYSEDEARGHE